MGPGLNIPLIEFDYSFDEFDDPQDLWAYLVVSALQAGYNPPIGYTIGYA